MHPVPRHRNHTPPVVPIDEPRPLDPYPERLISYTGVRPHTPLDSRQPQMVTTGVQVDGPLRFGDNSLPSVVGVRHRRRVPWAAAGLYAIGQLILALATAVGQIGATTAIVICLLWMICGLLLIAAQVGAERS